MAHKKGVGSSKNGRDSEAQRLGVKKIWQRKCVSWQYTCKTKRNKIPPR